MKVRESGMPDEKLWASFFDPESTLKRLGLTKTAGNVVDFGCGYGTFTVPAARLVAGQVQAFDIETDMIAQTTEKVEAAGLNNVQCQLRDFVAEGTGLREESVDYAMLFNILHAATPLPLLEESYRVLTPEGRLGIMHWNFDSTTPRGPSMDIRPHPEQCQAWAEQVGFHLLPPGIVDLPPYHYGMVLGKRR